MRATASRAFYAGTFLCTLPNLTTATGESTQHVQREEANIKERVQKRFLSLSNGAASWEWCAHVTLHDTAALARCRGFGDRSKLPLQALPSRRPYTLPSTQPAAGRRVTLAGSGRPLNCALRATAARWTRRRRCEPSIHSPPSPPPTELTVLERPPGSDGICRACGLSEHPAESAAHRWGLWGNQVGVPLRIRALCSLIATSHAAGYFSHTTENKSPFIRLLSFNSGSILAPLRLRLSVLGVPGMFVAGLPLSSRERLRARC
ncbi:hypothetical protein MTO96_006224 [Rhipicephalus appendiculatus]